MVQMSLYTEFWDTRYKKLVSKGVTVSDIKKIEQNIGITLPNLYKNLIKIHNGGMVTRDSFLYLDQYKNEEIVGNICMLPFNDGDYSSLTSLLIDPPEFFPKGLVPFADDGGGDLTCFDYRNCRKDPPIVFWVCGDNEGEDVHFVANNFEEFLDMLYNPED